MIDSNIECAAAILRRGGLVAFPTETVYGLGADATNPDAVAKILAAKGRPAKNPLIVHIAESSDWNSVASQWPELAQKLAEKFWPGPLTIVVPKLPSLPEAVTAGGPTVAIRVPKHPIALALLKACGVPLAAPSANRSGELSPTTAEHVRASLGDRVEVILDGGPCLYGLESTVVSLVDSSRILRPGAISRAEIEAVIGPVEMGSNSNAVLASPGMLTKHYSPRTAIECANSAEEAEFLIGLYETAGLKVARYECESGAKLYADLHRLDASGFDRIIAILPPDTEAWRTVRDRLVRAAAEE